MATTEELYAPKSTFSYYALTDTTNADGGYNSGGNTGQVYIGSLASTGTNPGSYVGVFGFPLYDFADRASIKGIESIKFSIYTTRHTDGYNGCVARIEYVGTSHVNYPALWRVGSSTEAMTLVEYDTAHYTTSDSATCTHFEDLIQNAVSGQYYYFRMVRESGMGAWLNDEEVRITITYSGTGAKAITPYIWAVPTTRHAYPETGMTAASSQSCVASTNSTYGSSYPVWRCFDRSTTTVPYASSTSASSLWVQLQMPKPLYSVKVTITNRNDRSDNIRGPIAGTIQGSNDGSTFTQIGSFSGRDGATQRGQSTITCTNSTTAYKYIRVNVTDWYPSGNNTYCAIGEIEISGYLVPETGGWIEADPYVYTADGWKTGIAI